MYVGSSTYPSKRVFTHDRCAGKNYDAVWFLPVEEAEREQTERHWIRTLCPVHNKANNPQPDPTSAGWGRNPADNAINLKLPGPFRDLFAILRYQTGCEPGVMTQMAVEHWALSLRIRLKPTWAKAIANYTTKPDPEFIDGAGI